jgi:hypothetical protein
MAFGRFHLKKEDQQRVYSYRLYKDTSSRIRTLNLPKTGRNEMDEAFIFFSFATKVLKQETKSPKNNHFSLLSPV